MQFYPFGIIRFIDEFQKDCLWFFYLKKKKTKKNPPGLQAQIVFIKINIDKISTYKNTLPESLCQRTGLRDYHIKGEKFASGFFFAR